jgi:hypothetical protein
VKFLDQVHGIVEVAAKFGLLRPRGEVRNHLSVSRLRRTCRLESKQKFYTIHVVLLQELVRGEVQ